MGDSEMAVGMLRVAETKRRGRKPAQFWVSFTTQEEPYKQRSAPCRHCLAIVNYHKKWEQAKSHLMKCAPFLRQMQGLDVYSRPEWFSVELEKRRRSTARLLPIDLLRADGDFGLALSAKTTPLKGSGRSKKRDSVGGGSGMTTSEVMLLQALRGGGRVDSDLFNHVVSREGAESKSVVNYLYIHVRRNVCTVLQQSPLVLSIKWDEERRVAEYHAANHKLCFFVDQVSMPEPSAEESEISGIAWLTGDIARVVTTLGLPVHHCVLDAPREVVSAVPPINSTINNETRVIPLRPSPRHALIEAINTLLSQSTEEEDHPLEGLVETAILCEDILRVLRVPSSPTASAHKQLEQSRQMNGLRSISLAEAFWTIVHSEKILGDAFTGLLEQSSVSDSIKDTVRTYLADPVFSTRLKRCHAVLQPLAGALESLSRPVVAISDAVVAFLTIRSHYTGDTTLPEKHKQLLSSLLASKCDAFGLGDYALMHLLDPAYVGELLDEESKVKAEHELLSIIRAEPNDSLIQTEEEIKQALFVEYTQFQLAAVQVRTTQDGFVFRMLKERKKTVLEYWLTNGRRWPLLHAIALGIEQTPIDATVPEPAHEPSFPPEFGESEKLRYLRHNVPLLSISELLQEPPLAPDTLQMFGEGISTSGVELC